MFCFPDRDRRPATGGRRTTDDGRRTFFRDDRGQAALEGLLAVAILVGLLLACFFLNQWGIRAQCARVGSRLLAFNAGDTVLAKLGVLSNKPVRQVASRNWDSLVKAVAANSTGDSVRKLFTLADSDVSSCVTGTAQGKLPKQASLFAYAPTTMGFNAADWATASGQWRMIDSVVQAEFVHLGYYVGLYRTSPNALDSTCGRSIPHGNRVLDSIYVRAGVW
jgi:hypothetical protein